MSYSAFADRSGAPEPEELNRVLGPSADLWRELISAIRDRFDPLAEDWTWSGFSLGRHQMPYVAAATLAGGNVRVGLEDNLYLSRGVLATNAQLVERAVTVVESLGASVIGPEETRRRLGLEKRAPA